MAQQHEAQRPGMGRSDGETKSGGQHIIEDAKHKVSETASQARHQAGDMAHEAREQAENLARKARQQASSRVEGQKERAAQQLGSISNALRQTSDTLRGDDQEMVAHYIEDAASQVDRAADFLRTHSVDDLVSRAENFARREPALFMGGAMLLGIAGARFFKSSSRPRTRSGPRGGGYSTHEISPGRTPRQSRPYPDDPTYRTPSERGGTTPPRTSQLGTTQPGSTLGSEADRSPSGRGTSIGSDASRSTGDRGTTIGSETGRSTGERGTTIGSETGRSPARPASTRTDGTGE